MKHVEIENAKDKACAVAFLIASVVLLALL